MHIILFFTFDISLKNWLESGLLDREILIYKKLVEKGINVTFVTFGDESDKLLIPKTNINIIPAYTLMNYSRYKIVRIVKSLMIPFKINNEIQQASVLKTNQLLGSWVPLIAKLLYKKPLYIRTGYDPLIFAIKNRKSCLISNHGQISIGNSIESAYELAEEVEKICEYYYYCKLHGEPKNLSKSEMRQVLKKILDYKDK